MWRLTGLFQAAPLLFVGGFSSYALFMGGLPGYLWVAPGLLGLLVAVLLVLVLPVATWRRWRYKIRPLEVDLQRGIVLVRRTLVPMARVQHVDTRRGPIQRRMGLSTVVFYTAAGPNEIPQLSVDTAARVRDRISELAQAGDSEL